MLECELCDYLKRVKGKDICRCGFTGHVFGEQRGFDLEEYPCRHKNYAEYSPEEPDAAESFEGTRKREESKRIFRLCGDDWRLLYRSRHPQGCERRAG